ncbi:iron-containing redox enzyme family protein [Nannocystis sp. SCPEA4]|uniref:TenA family transcriptional regulator n=1 Tax=Nannocystis sp. SCPEA4 TaxID=2996787 RepID=UPI00226F6883|nr:iron-containing redox enzyme family protein [Nannocystis sp. SCPEA4]MCY1061430.1 iron-containing redox enzyme family protein [Nannocystis sp. SCPEA4]
MTAAIEALVDAVRAALRDRAPRLAAAAATALHDLATRAFVDADEAAAATYHGLVWDLHADPDHRTYPLRLWLVQAGYAVEEACVPPVPPKPALGPDDLLARLAAEQQQRGGLAHPLSQHMFHGDPTAADLAIYLRHHWHRSRLFYRELTELALTCPLRHASVLHRNLHDETGGEDSERAHPFLLQRLLRHLGVPHGFHDRPELPEAQAYLNNRIRCARHPNRAWGLAVLYSLEAGTPAAHGNIYALLQRFGVPDDVREFHRVHMTADVEHARETAGLIGELVTSSEDQATLVASLRYHRALGRRYFDAIWREIQATR